MNGWCNECPLTNKVGGHVLIGFAGLCSKACCHEPLLECGQKLFLVYCLSVPTESEYLFKHSLETM